ncbi:hypothetical protein [Caballeronia sp. dw_19]|uniref:hypothetical protein n=1 Tax=Caballeronia sp. dw_19 TaxID=2719791 RepID=UPI00210270BA|nr:hypothetical protein [Caballeronia sp. dw_19]
MTSLSSSITESTNPPEIVGIRVRPVVAPLNTPLRTASGVMESAPLILIDVETAAGVTGSAYIFTYTPIVLPAIARLLDDVGRTLTGKPLAPASLTEALRKRFVLLGTPGLLDIALAGRHGAVGRSRAVAEAAAGAFARRKSTTGQGVSQLRHGWS